MNKPLLPTLPLLTEQEIAQERADRQQANRKWRGKSWRRATVNFAILSALAMSGSIIYFHFVSLPFDSVQWKASKGYEIMFTCSRMSSNLIDSKKLIGLNHYQTITLLGKPDQYNLRGWNMGYTLGFSIVDPIMLLIKFDKRKQVVECEVQTLD